MLAHKNAPAHTFCKDGIFYFRRRVPSDLSQHYTSRQIAFSLRTRSAAIAASRATRVAQQLDEHWYHLRIKERDLPGKHLLRMQQAGTVPMAWSSQATATDASSVKLSEASMLADGAGISATRAIRKEDRGKAILYKSCAGPPQGQGLVQGGSGLRKTAPNRCRVS